MRKTLRTTARQRASEFAPVDVPADPDRLANLRRLATLDSRDGRPWRPQGSTITAWPAAPAVAPATLFVNPAMGATITGSFSRQAGSTMHLHFNTETVFLSDGTQITFATTEPDKVVETV